MEQHNLQKPVLYPDCNEYRTFTSTILMTQMVMATTPRWRSTETSEEPNHALRNRRQPFVTRGHLLHHTIPMETESDNFYGSTTDITANENVFYFDVPLTTWTARCASTSTSGTNFQGISTTCKVGGTTSRPIAWNRNVSLNMDGMGEVWDDCQT